MPMANLVAFLRHQSLQIPLPATDDFPSSLKDRVDSYLSHLADQGYDDPLLVKTRGHLGEIAALASKLHDCLLLYLKGHTFAAYSTLSATLEPLVPLLQLLNEPFPDDTDMFYRARIVRGDQSLSRREMFHLPASLRHKVGTQRFSIQGLPCLYLGGSVLACWAELGEPNLADMVFSCVWWPNGQQISFLDLRHTAFWFAARITKSLRSEKTEKQLEAHLRLWPLFAACLTKAKHRQNAFVIEHVIPHMMLSWILEAGHFEGIAYPSTHLKVQLPPHLHSNYVFPATDLNGDFCSRLSTKFRLTTPISWSRLSAMSYAWLLGPGLPEVQLVDGIQEQYQETLFGEAEAKLQKILKSEHDRDLGHVT